MNFGIFAAMVTANTGQMFALMKNKRNADILKGETMTFFDVMAAVGDGIIAVLWFVVKFIGCLALTAVELIVMMITVLALIRFCVWLNGEMVQWWKERNDGNL